MTGLHEPMPALPDVAKIAVFRPSAVGDFMFALPALRSLRETYPDAEIVYLGRPWHAQFLAGRPGAVDRVVVVPPLPGMGLPAETENDAARASFTAAMVNEEFDIALQMYGGGRYANPLVTSFAARLTAGMRAPDAAPLDRSVAYGPWQNRRLQLLEVASRVGAGQWRWAREWEATAWDQREAQAQVPELGQERWAVIQPGASDPRRRWRPSGFAAVADALAAHGAHIAVHGSAEEGNLVHAVVTAMNAPALDLCGALSLSGLNGLLAQAALLVSNDTGPLHMAAALGTPCVGVYWFGNLIESGPLRQEGHRAVVSARVQCPVCGMDNLSRRCPHDPSFVNDVSEDEVIEAALAQFKSGDG